jgi:hypothetical protein
MTTDTKNLNLHLTENSSVSKGFMFEGTKNFGPDRGLNPEPLAPKARIIPLDHQATYLLKASSLN